MADAPRTLGVVINNFYTILFNKTCNYWYGAIFCAMSFVYFREYMLGLASMRLMYSFLQDIGAGKGKYYAVNYPLRDGIDDESYEAIFKPVRQ